MRDYNVMPVEKNNEVKLNGKKYFNFADLYIALGNPDEENRITLREFKEIIS
jgi:hypothetical protein